MIINYSDIMLTKKQVISSQQYPRNYIQKSTVRVETKRKRTTRKQAFQDGKVLIECQYCPVNQRRKYQSYPALYTHVNIKHPGCKVSSAKQKQKSQIYPVFKMMNILKKEYRQNQEVERHLITMKNITCLLLAQQLLKKQEYSSLTYRDQDQNIMNIVIQNTMPLIEQYNMNIQTFKMGQKGKIFQYQHTKVFPLSFGLSIVKYFYKKLQYSVKLYLSLIIIQCFDQSWISNQQRIRLMTHLWGHNDKPMNILIQYWQKWKQALKNHDNQINIQRQQSQQKES